MTNPENEPEDIGERIEDLSSRLGDFLEKAMSRSASHLAAEIKRLAKAEQMLEPYAKATFHLADIARDLLEPDACRAQAVELIALVESEDHARHIQPDFPQDAYESAVRRYSTCAYDNLADGTAMAQGYNSDGMHGCITDGLQVCQRSGRMECTSCFREYAADVYLAADDLPLALHQARLIAAPDNTRTPRGDRRWLGLRYQAWVLLLTGQLEAAEEAAKRSVELTDAPQMNLPMYAKLRAIPILETTLLLAGKQVPRLAEQPIGLRVVGQPAAGEYPLSDLYEGMVLALAASCRGDQASAIATLSRWDRLLQQQNCLHDWFEVRLRLTAAHLLADKRKQAESLAEQLQTKAKKARDWLTLRRLEHLMDPQTRTVPVPLLMPLDAGPFAGRTPTVSVAVPLDFEEIVEAPVPPPSPLEGVLDPLIARIEEETLEDEARIRVLVEVLSHSSTSVTHPGDAAMLLYLGGRLADLPGRRQELWAWAEPFAARFPQDAKVLNLLAWLGYCLDSNTDDQRVEMQPPNAIDKLFRQSLDLDPNTMKHFARAGLYYLSVGDLGEAERCLARGCRLDRTNGFVALRLAQVYRQTDRPRDGLMVLDTCLREGGDDPNVAWEAGMIALDLEQWESLVTYLNRYEEARPGEETTAYYTAFGLLNLDRPEDASTVLEERTPAPSSDHVEVLRACVQAASGQVSEFRAFLLHHLETARLSQWNNVPRREMVRLFGQLWKAAEAVREEPLYAQLSDFLLETGLAPDDLFEVVRQRGETRENGKYYRCVLRQPLDENWPSSRACLPNEESWTAYRIAWGVLAEDENEATRRAFEWQARCHLLSAEVEEVHLDSENYTDKFGIVWQGIREGVRTG